MKSNILVIDDSTSVRQQVGETLRNAGFRVDEATNGLQGKKAIEASPYACVICDVNMPLMNGIEMLEALEESESKQKLPIVMLTTEGSRVLIQKAKQAGASGWIVKPFNPELLVAAVRKLTALSVV